jgi:hypothetical protein
MRSAGSAKALGRHRGAVIPLGIPLLQRREWRWQIGRSKPRMKYLASSALVLPETIWLIVQPGDYHLGRPNHVNRIGFRSENVTFVDLLEGESTLGGAIES